MISSLSSNHSLFLSLLIATSNYQPFLATCSSSWLKIAIFENPSMPFDALSQSSLSLALYTPAEFSISFLSYLQLFRFFCEKQVEAFSLLHFH